jgi:putative spermidine/putrescine transport system permease protein
MSASSASSIAPKSNPAPAVPKATHEDAWRRAETQRLALLAAPAAAIFLAFWLLPIGHLILQSGGGRAGLGTYWQILSTPRYFTGFAVTIGLSAGVTLLTLAISVVTGLFLVRNEFPGRNLLLSVLTLPLAFSGVVVGFMVIMLAGRQGLVGSITSWLTGSKLIFAYSFAGLFVGYVYFSIPRVILTVMAAAEKLDRMIEEAARSLGATGWQVMRDVILPGLKPALISAGAICFATSMGAFGTAFTLNAGIDVLPMVIYNEFTLNANISVAAALSVILGVITWAVLAGARTLAGAGAAAGG